MTYEEFEQTAQGHDGSRRLLGVTYGGSVAKNSVATPAHGRHKTVYFILTSVAVCHLLNDMMSSSLLPSVYPMFKSLLHLSFRR